MISAKFRLSMEISYPMGAPTRSVMNHENYCLEEAEKAES